MGPWCPPSVVTKWVVPGGPFLSEAFDWLCRFFKKQSVASAAAASTQGLSSMHLHADGDFLTTPSLFGSSVRTARHTLCKQRSVIGYLFWNVILLGAWKSFISNVFQKACKINFVKKGIFPKSRCCFMVECWLIHKGQRFFAILVGNFPVSKMSPFVITHIGSRLKPKLVRKQLIFLKPIIPSSFKKGSLWLFLQRQTGRQKWAFSKIWAAGRKG